MVPHLNKRPNNVKYMTTEIVNRRCWDRQPVQSTPFQIAHNNTGMKSAWLGPNDCNARHCLVSKTAAGTGWFKSRESIVSLYLVCFNWLHCKARDHSHTQCLRSGDRFLSFCIVACMPVVRVHIHTNYVEISYRVRKSILVPITVICLSSMLAPGFMS